MGFIEELRNSLTRMMDGGYKPQHASDVTDEQRKKWADNKFKSASEENGRFDFLNMYNAQGDSYWTNGDNGFRSSINPLRNFANSHDFETRVYTFNYDGPNNTNNTVDPNEHRYSDKYKEGRVIVRVPRGADNAGPFGPTGDMGVYEAVLDNGQTLNAEDFKRFVGTASNFVWGDRLEGDEDNQMDSYKKYVDDRQKALMSEDTYAPYSYWDKQNLVWKRY